MPKQPKNSSCNVPPMDTGTGHPTSGLPSPQPRERPTSMRSTRPWQALVMPPSWMVWPTTWGWMDGLGGGTAGK